ncbi:DUF924 family protein [Chamaesiphon polymorphus]|uniref:DUF924 domain-containing protein n=1 Tax=Chamaesiphon polymorphus CCALA 037 TaxID=2107692 RepID=A0A2T1GLI6_9CYAN|nr:DUF924 family protein [Chamaesiphon polymorphus]PSB58637.1 DUF924 domain-containing protein [Chamaesiphon polymorphus CCALA 037]
MQTTAVEDVLQFWFPSLPHGDLTALVRQWEWWFRGGGDAEIVARFSPLLERAIRGELDDWDREPRSRLSLILILDQFSRTIYRGTDRSFAQDEKARALTLSGIELGHYTALETPWEKTFFFLPLGHAEQLQHLELSVQLADALVDESLPKYRSMLAFSAAQARRHRDVVAKFGRQPHRNELLGRISTPAELEYLAIGQLVHKHPFPPDLTQFLIQH